MRLSQSQAQTIRESVLSNFGGDAQVWLFGSRVRDDEKGGDIDLYIEVQAQSASDLMTSNDMRAGFTYGGITFEEYRGQVTDMNGASRRFIAAGEAHCFPLGTVATFSTYFAPADFNETANTLGQLLRLGGLFSPHFTVLLGF